MDDVDLVSAGYDAVFEATPRSPTLRRLWRENACGEDFPEEFSHISFVTLDGLRRMAALTWLEAGRTLVDLGCGMAGPALWLARETGASLIGVDGSTVAVTLATERAERLGLATRARFVHGTFAATTLPDAAADAATSEDALQYAPDKRALFTEAARIIRPAGRLVFTAFELEPERVAGLPVLGTDPTADYRPVLDEAGFEVDVYEEVPGIPEPLTRAYSSLVEARDVLLQEMGEAGVNALMGELALTLQVRPYRRRVLAAATRR
jgi:SAM-dependent methyltransferase